MNPTEFLPLFLHASATAQAWAEKRAESLFGAAVDHTFHYAGARQSELWLEVHHLYAPLFADPAFERIYRDSYAGLAREVAGRAVHVIGLGVGGGQKEGWLLEALHGAGCRLRYTPMDASPDLAWLSAQAGRAYTDLDIVPVVGDLTRMSGLAQWLDRYPAEELRLFTAIGFVHNFLPSRIFPWLRDLLRPGDGLVMSANLAPTPPDDDSEAAYRAGCEEILPQYDNRTTTRWVAQVLYDWDIAHQVCPVFMEIGKLEEILALVAHCVWLRDVAFPWEGREFTARAGDSLRLFFSLRYTPQRLARTLESHDLQLGEGWITPCRQEGVWRVGVS